MYIDRSTRNMAIYCLLGINVVSIIEFAFLPKPTTAFSATGFGPLKTIGKCWKIMFSSRIMWLTPTFIYVGVLFEQYETLIYYHLIHMVYIIYLLTIYVNGLRLLFISISLLKNFLDISLAN